MISVLGFRKRVNSEGTVQFQTHQGIRAIFSFQLRNNNLKQFLNSVLEITHVSVLGMEIKISGQYLLPFRCC